MKKLALFAALCAVLATHLFGHRKRPYLDRLDDEHLDSFDALKSGQILLFIVASGFS